VLSRELPENHAAEFAEAVARTWLAGRQLLRQMLVAFTTVSTSKSKSRSFL
jgi:hypothetical protein